MPWHVSKSSQCPSSKPWAVIKDSDSSVEGCHPTKQAALDHMAALYANEPGAKMQGCATCDERAAATSGPQHFRTSVDNSTWDGPAAMSACASSSSPASCYNAICAGKKAGDPATQAAHALPHHKTAGGPPNANGVSAALSALPKTDGLTNHDAALAHLQSHMKQINPDYQANAGEPPNLLRMRGLLATPGSVGKFPNGAARAQLFHGALFRAKTVKQNGREYFEVEGYASVVDTPYTMYDMFGPYEETIRGSAFDKSLSNPELDVAFLTNHKGVTMARTTNGTLALWADATGLGARALLNSNRQDVRDLVSAIEDGLIDEMSFAFYLNAGGWNESYDKFTIFEADIDRGDVSAVNYGANPYTSIGARAGEILHELAHLPLGAQQAAFTQLRKRVTPSMRALTSMDADESVNEIIAALDATLDSASDLVVNYDVSTCPPEVQQALDLLTGAEALADQLMDMLGIDDPDDTDSDEQRGHVHVPIVPSVTLSMGLDGRQGMPDGATHGAYDGTHSHAHAANGTQGSDETHTHSHSHAGDGDHNHAHANSAELPKWEADLLAEHAGRAVASGMSVALALELNQLDDENERDRD